MGPSGVALVQRHRLGPRGVALSSVGAGAVPVGQQGDVRRGPGRQQDKLSAAVALRGSDRETWSV